MMRLTVELDENDVAEVQKATGIRKKSPAVKRAVEDYLRTRARQQFLRRVCEGKTDYRTSNDAMESRGVYDPD